MVEEQPIPEKGQAVQEREDFSLLRLKLALQAGERRIHPLMDLKFEEIDNYPDLVPGPTVRYEVKIKVNWDTGDFFTTRWDNVATVEDPETRKLTTAAPESLTNLTGYGAVFQNPDHMVKRRPGKKLVYLWPREGLEAGIRQQLHILEYVDPANFFGEPQQLMRVIYFIEGIKRAFRQDAPVTREDLEQFREGALQLIDETNLLASRDDRKKHLAEMLIKATGTDSLGRVNTLATLMRTLSATLAATERMVVAGFIQRKSSATLGVLMDERNRTRFHLERAFEELWSIEDAFASGDVLADKDKLRSRIRRLATTPLTIPRLNPYLFPGRTARILLDGCPEDRKESNRKTLGNELADQLFSLAPATFLLGNLDPEEAGYESIGNRDRVAEAGVRVRLAKEIVREALDAEEHNNLTPSPKKPKAKKPATPTQAELDLQANSA